MDIDSLTAAEPVRINRLWATLAIAVPLVIFVTGFVWFMRTYVVPPEFTADAQPVLASAESPMRAAPAPPETTGQSLQVSAAPAAPEPPPTLPAPLVSSPFPSPPVPGAPAPVARESPFPSSVPAASPFPPPAPPDETSTRAVNLPGPMTRGQQSTVTAEPLAGPEQPNAEPVPRRPRITVAVARGPVPLPRPRPVN